MKKFFTSKIIFGHEISSSEEISSFKRPKHKFYLFFINKPVNYHLEFKLFNCEFFFGLYDNLNTAIIDHWIHFLHYGRKSGHVKFENNFYFDEEYYVQQYHPQLNKYHCFLEHYLKEGWKKGYNPSAFFDTEFYKNKYFGRYDSDYCPFEHFLKIGFSKGYLPFHVNFYSEQFPLSTEYVDKLPYVETNKAENYQVPFIKTSELPSDSITVFCPLGLGDAVALEPVFRFLRLKHSNKKVYAIFYPGQAEICRFNRNIDGIVVLNKSEDVRSLVRCISKNTIIVNCVLNGTMMSSGRSSFIWINPNNEVNIFNYYDNNCILSALSFCGGLSRLNVKPYFWKQESLQNIIPTKDKYIVVHCKSAEKTRTWPKEKFNELADTLLDKGYRIVEIGSERIIKSNSQNYFDFTKKIDFQDIYSLIEKSFMFIGVDSVFLHFANCACVKSICIAGPVKVRFNGDMKYFYNQKPCSGDFYYENVKRYCYPLPSKNIDSISTKDILETFESLES